MKTYKPTSSIKRQSQTEAPITSDNTLVDDTVALVDDPTALVGGNTTIYSAMMQKVKTIIPKVIIRIRH